MRAPGCVNRRPRPTPAWIVRAVRQVVQRASCRRSPMGAGVLLVPGHGGGGPSAGRKGTRRGGSRAGRIVHLRMRRAFPRMEAAALAGMRGILRLRASDMTALAAERSAVVIAPHADDETLG